MPKPGTLDVWTVSSWMRRMRSERGDIRAERRSIGLVSDRRWMTVVAMAGACLTSLVRQPLFLSNLAIVRLVMVENPDLWFVGLVVCPVPCADRSRANKPCVTLHPSPPIQVHMYIAGAAVPAVGTERSYGPSVMSTTMDAIADMGCKGGIVLT